ncbi:hypothetical protein D3C84_1077750 [compost metagenome]
MGVVAGAEAHAAGELDGVQFHLAFQLLDHLVAKDKGLCARQWPVGIRDHAVGIGAFVEGRGQGRGASHEQGAEQQRMCLHG